MAWVMLGGYWWVCHSKADGRSSSHSPATYFLAGVMDCRKQAVYWDSSGCSPVSSLRKWLAGGSDGVKVQRCGYVVAIG